MCRWCTAANYNYLSSQEYRAPLINAGRPSLLSYYKWARCAAKLMIYEVTRATIQHNFPRAILMTWWERYFIKATAPGTDTETQAVGKKTGTKYCPLTSRTFVWRSEEDGVTGGHQKYIRRGGGDRRGRGFDSCRTRLLLLAEFIRLKYECEFSRAAWQEPWGNTSETAWQSLKSITAHLYMKRVSMRLSLI